MHPTLLLLAVACHLASAAPADVWRPSAHDRVWLDGHIVEFGTDPNYVRLADVQPGSVFAFTATYRSDDQPQSPLIHLDGHVYDVSVASCATKVAGEWYAKDYQWSGSRLETAKRHTLEDAHSRVGNTYHAIPQNYYCRVTVQTSRTMTPELCEYKWDERYSTWGGLLSSEGTVNLLGLANSLRTQDGTVETVTTTPTSPVVVIGWIPDDPREARSPPIQVIKSHPWTSPFFDMPPSGFVAGCVMETNQSPRPHSEDMNITQGHFYHFADNKHTVTWINSLWSGGQSVESLLSKVQLSFWNDDAYSLVVEQHFNALPLVSNMSGYWNCLGSYESQAHIFTAPSFLSISDKDSTSFVNRVRGQFLDEPRSPSCLRLRQCIDSEWNGTHCVCLPGFEDSEQGCTPCPVGTYKPSSGRSACLRCPLHSSTETVGSMSIGQCACEANHGGNASGIGGDASLARGSANCTGCPMQMYKAQAGNTECTACPANSHTDSTGSVGCVCDQPNTVFFEGHTGHCVFCPSGTVKPGYGNSASLCAACSGHSVPDADQASCVCAPGYFRYDGDQCRACPAGMFRNEEMSHWLCGYCRAGWVSSEGVSACIPGPGRNSEAPCGQGFYKSVSGATQCTSCPGGSTTMIQGATSPELCLCSSRRVRSPGVGSEWNGTSCVRCGEGEYAIVADMAGCRACPPRSAPNLDTSSYTVNVTSELQWVSGYTVVARPKFLETFQLPFAMYFPDCKDDQATVFPAGNIEFCASGWPYNVTLLALHNNVDERVASLNPDMSTIVVGYTGAAPNRVLVVELTAYTLGSLGARPAIVQLLIAEQTSATTATINVKQSPDSAWKNDVYVLGRTTEDNAYVGPLTMAPATFTFSRYIVGCLCQEGATMVRGSCECLPGWFMHSNGTCVQCAEGTYKGTVGSDSCTPCTAHATSPRGSPSRLSCTCEANFGGDASAEGGTCQACVGGTKDAGNGNCMCNLKVQLADPAVCMCKVGYEPGPEACSPCPFGYYKNTTSNTPCVACPPNSNTTASGAVSLDSCQCNDNFGGDARTGAACLACPIPKPSANNPCFCPDLMTTSTNVCECMSGFQSLAGQCSACGAGTAKLSSGNSTTCAPCVAGTAKASTGPGVCAACADFASSAAGASECTCNPGYQYYRQPDRRRIIPRPQCSLCPPSTFKGAQGNTRCTYCLNGYHGLFGSTSASDCACRQDYGWNGTACAPCAAGTFKNSVFTGSCSACPAGAQTYAPSDPYELRLGDITQSWTPGAMTSVKHVDFATLGPQYTMSAPVPLFFSVGALETLTAFVEGEGDASVFGVDMFFTGRTEFRITLTLMAQRTGSSLLTSFVPLTADFGWTGTSYPRQSVVRVTGRFFGLEQVVTFEVSVSEASGSSDQPLHVSVGPVPATDLVVSLSAQLRVTSPKRALGELTGQTLTIVDMPLSQWSAQGATAPLFLVPPFERCVCPENKYLSGSECVACPAGSTRPAFSAGIQGCTCLDANAVWSSGLCLCAAGMTLAANGTCVGCPLGTWKSTAGNGQCNSCPLHSSTVSMASTSRGSCQCIANYGGNASAGTDCAACQGGSKPMGNAPCDCFSPSAVADATGALCQCIAGTGGNALSGANGCAPCATGWFKATAGNAQCQQCPPHSATNGTTSEQCACLEGYGGDARGSTCHLCVGSTKPTAGNYPCLCNDTNAVEAAGKCACIAGFEGDATKGPGSCTPCAKGTYKGGAGSDACMQCPQHSTTAFSGQTIVDACQCVAGFGGVAKSAAGCGQCFLASKSAAGNGECECVEHAERYNASHCQCSAGHQASGNTCVECPLNTFKAGPGFGQCTPCAADASTLSTGATGRASCLCNAGYGGDASQEGGVCTQCTSGLFKPVGNGQCSACPEGATSTTPGSTNKSDCVCNAGRRGDASVEGGTCTACPAGTFKSVGNGDVCSPCPGNSTSSEGAGLCSCLAGFQPVVGSVDQTCAACPKGSYKADAGNAQCTQCGDKETTRSLGATKKDDCYVSLSSAARFSLALMVAGVIATL
eukprot:m51a1_g7441 hypothetical protein (2024) ;mRNA; f:79303-86365